MTPADRRITELIDKWLKSIDLHLKYAELNDADYARSQKWPKHDRPTRWVLEVAKQKVLELKSHCESRQAMGDGKFAESLELMAFLANLVGIQHIQRFIPLADESGEIQASSTTETVEAPTVIKTATRARLAAAAEGDESTREMPRLKPTPVAVKPAPAVRQEQPKAQARPVAAAAPKANAPAKADAPVKADAAPKEISSDLRGKIITDAVRLMKWGKPWHELAELIGRIADRPAVPEIRKVLRAHKNEIESKVRFGSSSTTQ